MPKRNIKVLDERLDSNGHKIVEYEDEFGKRFTEDKGLDYKFLADQRRQDTADKRLEAALSSQEDKKNKLSAGTSELFADIQNPQNYVTDKATGSVKKYKVDDSGNFVTKKNSKGQYEYVEDPEGQPMPISESDKQFKQTNAQKNIMIQKLSSRNYDFVNNIEKSWGRKLSPKELKEEAIKHAKAGNLTDKEAGELAEFLPYYKEIYSGIK